jgi:hypothetical protein
MAAPSHQDYLKEFADIITQKLTEEKPCASDILKAHELGATIEQLDYVIKTAVAAVKGKQSGPVPCPVPHFPHSDIFGGGSAAACKATLVMDQRTWSCMREKGHAGHHNSLFTDWSDENSLPDTCCMARAQVLGVSLCCSRDRGHEGSHVGKDAMEAVTNKMYVWQTTPPSTPMPAPASTGEQPTHFFSVVK